jgi:DNA-binding CsgD family transcriptional regulator
MKSTIVLSNLLFGCLFGVLLGLARLAIGDSALSLSLIASAGAAIIVAVYFVGIQNHRLKKPFQMAIFVGICGFAALVISESLYYSYVVVFMGYIQFCATSLAVCIAVSRRKGKTPSVQLFAVSLAFDCLGLAIGLALYNFIPLFEQPFLSWISIGCVLVLALSGMFLFDEHRIYMVERQDVSTVGTDSSLVARCVELSSEHKLTARQEEVFILLASGMRVSEICDNLCISVGTARTHVYHIYQKLGVHNYDELKRILNRN